ncbi:MAG: hypothetical protein ACRYF0_17920 [Janthinobacterium lividum]
MKKEVPLGTILSGSIYARMPFGVFYDAGVGFPVLLQVTEFGKPGMNFPNDYPELDSAISGRLAGFSDDNRQVRVVWAKFAS